VISLAEFEIALLGLLRLARFDAGFAGFFDLSREGARRSFRIALPLLPISLFLRHLNAVWPAGTDMVRVVVGELIGYSLSWICFPLLLMAIRGWIDREARIYGAIALYNWISVLALAMQLPIAIAAYYGLSDDWAGGLSDVVLLFLTACEFFAFQRLLAIRIELTLALVVVDFVLSNMIMLLGYGLSHALVF
jgi:hypothetical protein